MATRDIEPVQREVKIKVHVAEHTRTSRIVQLAALRIYHERKIKDLNDELDFLLAKEVNSLEL